MNVQRAFAEVEIRNKSEHVEGRVGIRLSKQQSCKTIKIVQRLEWMKYKMKESQ